MSRTAGRLMNTFKHLFVDVNSWGFFFTKQRKKFIDEFVLFS